MDETQLVQYFFNLAFADRWNYRGYYYVGQWDKLGGGPLLCGGIFCVRHMSEVTHSPGFSIDSVIDIVDDDPEQTKILSLLLGDKFGKTKAWNSASAWMSAYAPNHPTVLIVDYFFPGERVSGEDVLDWIASNHYPIIPLIVSGDVDVERCRDWMRKGAIYVIPKPITRAAFVKLAPVLSQAKDASISKYSDYLLDNSIRARLAKCTQREREIVFKRLQGTPPKSIAEYFGCKYRTVVKHFSNAMSNLVDRADSEQISHDSDELQPLEHIQDKVRLYRLLLEEFSHLEDRGNIDW